LVETGAATRIRKEEQSAQKRKEAKANSLSRRCLPFIITATFPQLSSFYSAKCSTWLSGIRSPLTLLWCLESYQKTGLSSAPMREKGTTNLPDGLKISLSGNASHCLRQSSYQGPRTAGVVKFEVGKCYPSASVKSRALNDHGLA
jgi:hypothetical protein